MKKMKESRPVIDERRYFYCLFLSREQASTARDVAQPKVARHDGAGELGVCGGGSSVTPKCFGYGELGLVGRYIDTFRYLARLQLWTINTALEMSWYGVGCVCGGGS